MDPATGLMKPTATGGLTEEQQYADNFLHAMGCTVETGVDGSIAVRMPEPPAAGNADLFRRTDEQWFRLTGSFRQAIDLSDASRAERAATLARHGALTPRELEHLRYLADAADPVDAVDDGQQPIASADAQAAIGALGDQQSTSPRSGWSTQ